MTSGGVIRRYNLMLPGMLDVADENHTEAVTSLPDCLQKCSQAWYDSDYFCGIHFEYVGAFSLPTISSATPWSCLYLNRGKFLNRNAGLQSTRLRRRVRAAVRSLASRHPGHDLRSLSGASTTPRSTVPAGSSVGTPALLCFGKILWRHVCTV